MIDKSNVLKNKRGAVLIYTTMVMMILAVCCVSFTLIAVNMYKNTTKTASKQQSFLFAKSIGQSFAIQLANEYEAATIVSFLEDNIDTAATVTGTVSMRYDKTEDEENGEGYKELRDIDISTAKLKFYFVVKCKDCGVRLENTAECPRCHSTEKNADTKYLYVDVTVAYNGATELVSSVFTYLDQGDFKQTMVDLFSVYNIYSTFPSEMKFNFAQPEAIGNSEYPNVYLYNGSDVQDKNGNIITQAEYKVETSIKANLTSTGDVKVTGKGSSLEIGGTVTSYGAIQTSNIKLKDLYSRGGVIISSDSVVTGSIYGRGTVTVYGNNTSSSKTTKNSVNKIEALGNVTLENCNVQEIVGGSDCKVTLINSTCANINTKGSVILKNGSYCNTIVAGKSVEIYDSSVGSSIIAGEDVKLSSSSSSKITEIGTLYKSYSSNSTAIVKAVKDLNYSVTNSGKINVYGSLDIDGGMKNSGASGTFYLTGNISVEKGYAKSGASDEATRVSDFACLKMAGDITLENHVPLFKGKCEIGYLQIKSGGAWYEAFELFSSGDLEKFKPGESSALDLLALVERNSVDKYADLKGSVIKGIVTSKTSLAIQNATITEFISGDGVALYGIEIGANASVNCSSVAVIGKDSKIYGKIYAKDAVIQREGSYILASENQASEGLSNGVQTGGYAFLDGEISGEVVCGDPVSCNGTMYIQENAILKDNPYNKNIYVYGTLNVVQHIRNANYDDTTGEPRIIKEYGVGNNIYVSGNVYLSGWVCNLYVNGNVMNGEPPSGYCQPKFVKGDSTVISDVVLIGKEGYQDSEGAKFINDNVIVYIYETPRSLAGLSVAGTLVIGNGVELSCDSIICNNIIGGYSGVTASECKENRLQAIAKLKSDINTKLASGDINSTVSNLTVKYHFQSNMQLPQDKTLTFDNCTFNGWFKMSNSKGTVKLNRCSVSGANAMSYTGEESANGASRGCIDVSDGKLELVSSYIGGTNTSKTSSALGNVSAKDLTISGGKVWGNVYCEKISDFNSNAVINGNLQMTANQRIEWTNGSINGSIYAPTAILTVKGGRLGSSLTNANISGEDKKDIVVGGLVIESGASIGNYMNVYLKSASFKSELRGTLGNVKADGNLTIKGSSSKVGGVLYVSGDLYYDGVSSPTAEKGLYANNISGLSSGTTTIFLSKIDGNVSLPNYAGDLQFQTISGSLYAPKANITSINGCSGNAVVKSMTIKNNGSNGTFKGIACTEDLNISGWTYSNTISITGDVVCNNLFAKTMVPKKTTIGFSYESVGSATVNLYFSGNVKANGYCYLSYTSLSRTLYTLKGMYAQYCNFTGTDCSSFIVNGTGSGYGANVRNSTIKGHVYVCERSASFVSTEFGTNYTNTRYNLDKYSRTYKFLGEVTLSGSTVHGASFNTRNTINLKTKFIVSKGLTLSNGSTVGYLSTRGHAHTGYDGLYVGGNLSIDPGCTVHLNTYVNGSITNNGCIKLMERSKDLYETNLWGIGSDNYTISACGGIVRCGSYTRGSGDAENYCSLDTKQYRDDVDMWIHHEETPHMMYNGSDWVECNRVQGIQTGAYTTLPAGYQSAITVADPTAGSTVDILGHIVLTGDNSITGVALEVAVNTSVPTITPSEAHNIHYFALSEKKPLSPKSVTNSRLDTSNRIYWKPMAIPLRWYLPTTTNANTSVSLNTSTNNVMSITNHYIAQEVQDNLEAVKQSAISVRDTDISLWSIFSDTKELIDRCAKLIDNIGKLFKSLPLLYTPSSKYLGLTFANKTDASFYRVSASNISKVLKDAKGADMMLLTRKTIVADKTFPSGDLLDLLTKYTSYDPSWVIPIAYHFSMRPVGMVFFNSGIVPESAVDATYRDNNSKGTEKDSNGRWYWGSGSGITSENIFTGINTPANDVCWTFFTCDDPTNPYGSPAKDLHIILPKNTKMIWSKDKDSTVSIIGNGRVFLYLQEGTDIKVIGNGLTNWLHEGWDDSSIGKFFNQFSNGNATYNVFGGVRYVATTGYGDDKQTYYDSKGNILLDQAALNTRNYELQPRMYIIGTGGDISFEVQDFQTAAYVYMPSGYSYGDYLARNKFTISTSGIGSSDNWDIYGVYVCDNFDYVGGTNSKVHYVRTVPDLSNTEFKYTSLSNYGTVLGTTLLNGREYQLAEFWDYPVDLPVSSMKWYYRGISIA